MKGGLRLIGRNNRWYDFSCEDVLPYYDLYPDGSIVIFVELPVKMSIIGRLFGRSKKEIVSFKDKDVFFKEQQPERITCGKR